ncbi:hypothetical protein B0J11DRAFT_502950 [Dendryphion nanum]|uniref:Uncharacterized protein n=1 Tax=Dendryphion nanum TaxID=256645 RepID=A0A9P9EFH0_9PLEO|nr:hypothetical protein B0J11DRAFT_502950 [Dendryphion nanum]
MWSRDSKCPNTYASYFNHETLPLNYSNIFSRLIKLLPDNETDSLPEPRGFVTFLPSVLPTNFTSKGQCPQWQLAYKCLFSGWDARAPYIPVLPKTQWVPQTCVMSGCTLTTNYTSRYKMVQHINNYHHLDTTEVTNLVNELAQYNTVIHKRINEASLGVFSRRMKHRTTSDGNEKTDNGEDNIAGDMRAAATTSAVTKPSNQKKRKQAP